MKTFNEYINERHEINIADSLWLSEANKYLETRFKQLIKRKLPKWNFFYNGIIKRYESTGLVAGSGNSSDSIWPQIFIKFSESLKKIVLSAENQNNKYIFKKEYNLRQQKVDADSLINELGNLIEQHKSSLK